MNVVLTWWEQLEMLLGGIEEARELWQSALVL